MSLFIIFSVFQKKQNTAISVSSGRDIRLSQKSENYHPYLLHKPGRMPVYSASGYNFAPEKYPYNIAPHAPMDRTIVKVSGIVDIHHASAHQNNSNISSRPAIQVMTVHAPTTHHIGTTNFSLLIRCHDSRFIPQP